MIGQYFTVTGIIWPWIEICISDNILGHLLSVAAVFIFTGFTAKGTPPWVNWVNSGTLTSTTGLLLDYPITLTITIGRVPKTRLVILTSDYSAYS